MAPETDPALPPAPAPRPDVREAALGAALARFDSARGVQGLSEPTRPRKRNAFLETPLMARTRLAVATAAVALIAAPIAWQIARDRPLDQASDAAAPARPDATPAPTTAGPASSAPDDAFATLAPPAGLAPPTALTPPPEAPLSLPPVPAMPGKVADAPAARAEAERAVAEARARVAAAPSEPRSVEARAAAVRREAEVARAASRREAASGRTVAEPLARSPVARSLGAPGERSAMLAAAPPAPAPMVGIGFPGDAPRRVAHGDVPAAPEPTGGDRFAGVAQSGFHAVREQPVSTFSIDVDTASYGFSRAALNRNVLPQKDAVRPEEMINYFPYSYEGPASASEPFRIDAAVFPSPWAEGRKIMRLGIKGYALRPAERPAANLVFLIDTSGSMGAPNRLPLVKQALGLLLTQIDARDRVAIVTYAGHAGIALEPTPASETQKILGVIEGLEAGGGTAGGEGIRQAYALASRNIDPKGVNRVMLATDGDFNVGITGRGDLTGFVERERGKGIYLSVLGFGMGNYNDALMQALAQNGNGAAAYIDTLGEARKVLVEEATSTLIPIAKDVKIQVEFNPAAVAEYRLIGYETRALAREDFTNDAVDAGEVGSGQSVTALYEIVPVGGPTALGALRYGAGEAPAASAQAGEYAHVAVRYKLPDADASREIGTAIGRAQEAASFESAPQEARFATAVAGFAEILRGGKYTGKLGLDDVARIAAAAKGEDPFGYRAEFVQLVRAAKTAKALAPLRP